ncbi:uncharacterized protein LOC143291577 isoform X2 [Babylonia areolata]
MSTECESLIRRMLVLEPSRRYSIARIKQHEWMLLDGGCGGRSCPPSPTLGPGPKVGQYNEQILRIMQGLGIDQQKTMEALQNDAYDHYTAIYYLLLDRLRQHRSSFPSDTRIDARRRRPSTIAEQAMLHMLPSQVMGIPRPQLSGMKQGRLSHTLDSTSPLPPTLTSQPSPTTTPTPHPYPTLGSADSEMMPPPPNVPHCMSDMLPRAPPTPPPPPTPQVALTPGNVITTSIDEGVEADIMDRERESAAAEAASHSSRFAALQRDPYGLGLLPEYGYGYLDGGSYTGGGGVAGGRPGGLATANSSSSLNAACLSPFTSFDSSLEVDVASGGGGSSSSGGANSADLSSSPQGLLNSALLHHPHHHHLSTTTTGATTPGMAPGTSSITPAGHSPFLQVRPPGGVAMGTSLPPGHCLSHCSTVPARLGEDNSGTEGDSMGVEEVVQDRGQTRSPVNFREGRRASDGLVAQGIIAFRQRLRECMRARGMVELRQEHHQLQLLYASSENNNNYNYSYNCNSNSNNNSSSNSNTVHSPDSHHHHHHQPSPSTEPHGASPTPPTTTTTTMSPSSQPPPPPPAPHPHPHPHRKLSAPHHGTRQWSLDDPGVGGQSGGVTLPPRRRPLMKRMSLPSESFDIQPHRLLALKQSLYLEQQLDRAGNSAGPHPPDPKKEGLPMAPPSQPPLAPPLPCSASASASSSSSSSPVPHQPYDYATATTTTTTAAAAAAGGKSLQQQLMPHRLQQKRQVFQKHSVPHHHHHAPHPHPSAPPHNQLPLPQQLSSQMQQLQIDPNNLPRIDFGPQYAVQPPLPQGQPGPAHAFTAGFLAAAPSSDPAYTQPAAFSAPSQSCQGDFPPPTHLLPLYAFSSSPSCSSSSTDTATTTTATSATAVSSSSPADSFLEQIGMDEGGGGGGNEGRKDSCCRGEGVVDGREEEEVAAAATDPPSTPTHQWQRRTGVFMAVHPFQDSSALGVAASRAAAFHSADLTAAPPGDGNRGPAFSAHTDSSALFSSRTDDSHSGFSPSLAQGDACSSFFSLGGPPSLPPVDKGMVLASPPPVQTGASSPHDDHLTMYHLHFLHSSPDPAGHLQSLQGLRSGTGTVDLVGFAPAPRLEASHHGNPSLLFCGGDGTPTTFQSCQPGLSPMKCGSGEFTVSEQNDEQMDIS